MLLFGFARDIRNRKGDDEWQISPEQLEQMEQSIDRERKGIIATADFVVVEELHRELIERIRKYHPNTDITMIEKAYHTPIQRTRGSAVSRASLTSSIRFAKLPSSWQIWNG